MGVLVEERTGVVAVVVVMVVVVYRWGVIEFRGSILKISQNVYRQCTTAIPLDWQETPESPERDLVNFPRRLRPEFPGKVRYGFIPEEWFTMFYDKTGVTGPYIFSFSLSSYLISKEIFVLNHDYYTGISLFMMVAYAVRTLGPTLAVYLDEQVDKIEEQYRLYRELHIKTYEDGIDNEKKEQWRAHGQKELFNAKKINVAVQLEAEYRERLMEAYQKVKDQLDNEVARSAVTKCMKHKHMTSWVARNVMESLDDEFATKYLRQCIVDLNTLASVPLLPISDSLSPDKMWLHSGRFTHFYQLELQISRSMVLLVVFKKQKDKDTKLSDPLLVLLL
ncbi:ATP synthase subunit b, mitochondrial [Anabrus simplex]|uniref:ATP synthase subunit b, mitochondrial n=1 Tax=Anabrus simplex TaxID=316456 RepID=UPI0035A29B64